MNGKDSEKLWKLLGNLGKVGVERFGVRKWKEIGRKNR